MSRPMIPSDCRSPASNDADDGGIRAEIVDSKYPSAINTVGRMSKLLKEAAAEGRLGNVQPEVIDRLIPLDGSLVEKALAMSNDSERLPELSAGLSPAQMTAYAQNLKDLNEDFDIFTDYFAGADPDNFTNKETELNKCTGYLKSNGLSGEFNTKVANHLSKIKIENSNRLSRNLAWEATCYTCDRITASAKNSLLQTEQASLAISDLKAAKASLADHVKPLDQADLERLDEKAQELIRVAKGDNATEFDKYQEEALYQEFGHRQLACTTLGDLERILPRVQERKTETVRVPLRLLPSQGESSPSTVGQCTNTESQRTGTAESAAPKNGKSQGGANSPAVTKGENWFSATSALGIPRENMFGRQTRSDAADRITQLVASVKYEPSLREGHRQTSEALQQLETLSKDAAQGKALVLRKLTEDYNFEGAETDEALSGCVKTKVEHLKKGGQKAEATKLRQSFGETTAGEREYQTMTKDGIQSLLGQVQGAASRYSEELTDDSVRNSLALALSCQATRELSKLRHRFHPLGQTNNGNFMSKKALKRGETAARETVASLLSSAPLQSLGTMGTMADYDNSLLQKGEDIGTVGEAVPADGHCGTASTGFSWTDEAEKDDTAAISSGVDTLSPRIQSTSGKLTS
ncbi:hypothetical protein I316_00270 [Kwoniella heveanensis BCC8398]|uniref:Uncharacterized protein n=1 Tax=Kwoniella heveanensis BCC8398 TaxID=1296120 RepID=A0A1B9H452_9TREE|nr:hypothetical protein I316_00270 [Kwoniella heveanensis BCC8398]